MMQNASLEYLEACKLGNIELFRNNLGLIGDQGVCDSLQRNALHQSICSGNVELVQMVLNVCMIDVNGVDSHNCSAQWYACKNGRQDLVRQLQEKDANTHTSDNLDRTLLHISCLYGHIDLVSFLLPLLDPKEINARDRYNNTAQQQQFQSKSVHDVSDYIMLMDMLLSYDAEMNVVNTSGYGVLYYITILRDVAHREELIIWLQNTYKHLINIHLLHKNQHILYYICQSDYNGPIQKVYLDKYPYIMRDCRVCLLKKCFKYANIVRVQQKCEDLYMDDDLLIYLGKHKHWSLILELLCIYSQYALKWQNYIDGGIQGNQLNLAAREREWSILHDLLSAYDNVDCNLIDSKSCSIQEYALKYGADKKSLVKLLIQKSNSMVVRKQCILFDYVQHYICRCNYDEYQECLQEHHGDGHLPMHIQGSADMTPIIIAIYNNNIKSVHALLKYKANINDTDSQGSSVLAIACNKNIKLVQDQLQTYHTDININHYNLKTKQTPFHVAQNRGNLEIMTELVKYHADYFITDKNDNTPLHRIILSQDAQKIDFFLETIVDSLTTQHTG